MLSFLLNELAGNGDKKLKSVDLIAIGVGFGITLCLSLMILYYMIQGIRRRNRENPDGEKSVNGEVNVYKCLFLPPGFRQIYVDSGLLLVYYCFPIKSTAPSISSPVSPCS